MGVIQMCQLFVALYLTRRAWL